MLLDQFQILLRFQACFRSPAKVRCDIYKEVNQGKREASFDLESSKDPMYMSSFGNNNAGRSFFI